MLALAGVGAIALQFVRQARELLLPVWADHLELSHSEVGFVASLSFGVDLACFPLAGILMDRFGRKASAVPALVLIGLGLGLLPLADCLWKICACAAITGVGNGLSSGVVMTLGTDIAPDHAQGIFLGLWGFIQRAGAAAGPAVVGAVASASPGGVVDGALFAAGVAALGVLWVTFVLPETRPPR